MARVVLRNVEKTYAGGTAAAVRDFNLDVADGEFVVFVGPSGCGKSTTLRCIAGLEEVTGGTIHIGGRLVNDVQPKDRDIAMVFQNYALYPHMTVYENMAFALKIRKTPRQAIGQAVDRTARILGIDKILGRKPKTLSGGQRQRVALGRAIVRNPKCFLFDEPLSNLDAKLRGEMRAEIKRLHLDLKSTTIYVTHDQEEAMTLGDRVVVMKDGVIQQCGAPLQVYQRPINRFVAGFVGTPAMNFFEGTIASDAGRLWFDEGAGRLAIPGWATEALRARVGSKVVLGARPQAIGDGGRASANGASANGAAPGQGNTLPMRVEVVEPLGDKLDVYLSTPRHRHVIARVEAGRPLAPDQTIAAHFDLERIHFFEATNAGALLATAAAEPA
ncbi:MAG TPA: sn-glycerol-3-phosphate ABC transporter ATP-binding protein UgpC [Polyangia bacterium]|nr:sn-glycerol-3-phosphate ABC transporter ATP-binding protein UgpC [Polyangia bacterium]